MAGHLQWLRLRGSADNPNKERWRGLDPVALAPIFLPDRPASPFVASPGGHHGEKVNLWQATNPKARDFRLLSIGKAYKKSTLKAEGKGTYVARVKKPASGWTAFFVELVFASGDKDPYKFTTQVHIVPDVLPHSFEEFRKTLKKAPKGDGKP